MADRTWTTHVLAEIDFVIRFSRGEGFPEGWADFEIYEIVGVEMSPKEGALIYRSRGTDHGETYDLADAEVFGHGYVKWDGCCEISLHEESHHMCGRRDGEKFGKMLLAIWDIASTFLEKWDHACADTTPPGEKNV